MKKEDSTQGRLTAFHSGKMFATAFRMLYRDFPALANVRHPEYAMVVLPALVNGLMAAELFLKFLIGDSRKKIHDLKLLLDQLQETDFETYQMILPCMIECMHKKGQLYTKDNFEHDVNLYRKAFIDFRYLYDSNQGVSSEPYNMAFVECLVATLEGISDVRYSEKNS